MTEREKQIIDDYMSGMYLYLIAEKYRVSSSTVYKIAKAYGVKLHGRGRKRERPIVYPAVAKLMDENELSYVDIAQACKCKPIRIQEIMTGRRGLTYRYALKIANAMGWDVGVFENPEKHRPLTLEEVQNCEDHRALYREDRDKGKIIPTWGRTAKVVCQGYYNTKEYGHLFRYWPDKMPTSEEREGAQWES